MDKLEQFLNPINRYYGTIEPENLVFNYNLQEFTHRTTFICCLQTGGKLTPTEAFQAIEELWERLEASKISLGIGNN